MPHYSNRVRASLDHSETHQTDLCHCVDSSGPCESLDLLPLLLLVYPTWSVIIHKIQF